MIGARSGMMRDNSKLAGCKLQDWPRGLSTRVFLKMGQPRAAELAAAALFDAETVAYSMTSAMCLIVGSSKLPSRALKRPTINGKSGRIG